MNASIQLYGSPGDQLSLVLFAQELEEFLAREGVSARIDLRSELPPDLQAVSRYV